MSTLALTNLKAYLAGYDISGDLNAAALEYGAEMLDVTTFGQTNRIMKAGMKTVGVNLRGFWNGGTDLQDEAMFSRIGAADEVLTMSPDGADDGETAYFTQLVAGQYQPEGEVAGMLAFSFQASGRGIPLVRGTVAKRGTASSTGVGTGYQLGSVGATQRMWATAHVLSVSGTSPTLDLIIESGTTADFSVSATRITFTQFTARGAQRAVSVAGISHGWWRASWTLGGTSPSFAIVVAFGIF